MVCLRNVSVDTLHKGDTEDVDDDDGNDDDDDDDDNNNNNNNNNAGTDDIRTMNSYIRIVATHCSVGTWFVSGI
jgi:hypothetical protein